MRQVLNHEAHHRPKSFLALRRDVFVYAVGGSAVKERLIQFLLSPWFLGLALLLFAAFWIGCVVVAIGWI